MSIILLPIIMRVFSRKTLILHVELLSDVVTCVGLPLVPLVEDLFKPAIPGDTYMIFRTCAYSHLTVIIVSLFKNNNKCTVIGYYL